MAFVSLNRITYFPQDAFLETKWSNCIPHSTPYTKLDQYRVRLLKVCTWGFKLPNVWSNQVWLYNISNSQFYSFMIIKMIFCQTLKNIAVWSSRYTNSYISTFRCEYDSYKRKMRKIKGQHKGKLIVAGVIRLPQGMHANILNHLNASKTRCRRSTDVNPSILYNSNVRL